MMRFVWRFEWGGGGGEFAFIDNRISRSATSRPSRIVLNAVFFFFFLERKARREVIVLLILPVDLRSGQNIRTRLLETGLKKIDRSTGSWRLI